MSLERFVSAQQNTYETALREIKAGCKCSHWMWYIFPQIKGLGFSPTAMYYEIQSLDEAKQYISHPLLFPRLLEISEALTQLEENDAELVMGWPDNLKLKSSMTLFYLVSGEEVFGKVLEKYFGGEQCAHTVDFLKNS